jgi:hypothetical protein
VEVLQDEAQVPFPDGAVTYEHGNGLHVTFTIHQLWKEGKKESISWITPTYMKGGNEYCNSDGKPHGDKRESVKYEATASYTAECNADGFAIVNIYVHDGSFNDLATTNKPDICSSGWAHGTGVAHYELKIPCDPCIDSRRGLSGPGVDEPSSDQDSMPYCLSDDFPCEGDEANMVYVCHYSARKGYQTFCVPEADSDILRFYSHDYCGPCEGGQGVTWGEITN